MASSNSDTCVPNPADVEATIRRLALQRFETQQRHALSNSLHFTGVYTLQTGCRQDPSFFQGRSSLQTFPLVEALVKEINGGRGGVNQHQSSFVVLGDSGVGKSRLALRLCEEYWNHIDDPAWGRIPIYIYLPQYSRVNNLLKQYFGNEIRGLRLSEVQSLKYLLVLDSYDELQEPLNIFKDQSGEGRESPSPKTKDFCWTGAPEQFQDVKVVTLTRKQGLDPTRRRKLFAFSKVKNDCSGASEGHSEFFICPFSHDNIHSYLKDFVHVLKSSKICPCSGTAPALPFDCWCSGSILQLIKKNTHGTKWEEWPESESEDGQTTNNSNEFLHWFNKLPDLFELGTTPLLLTFILAIMPGMLKDLNSEFPKGGLKKLQELKKLCRTKTGIYDKFTDSWFKFQAERIWKSQRPTDFFKGVSNKEELLSLFRLYSQNLAHRFLQNGNYEESISLDETEGFTLMEPHKNPDLQKTCQTLFPSPTCKVVEEEATRLTNLRVIRDGCILQFSADSGASRCRFSHYSLVVYFGSVYLFQNMELLVQLFLNNETDRIDQEISRLFLQKPLEHVGILAELSARVTLHKTFAKALLDIIHQSRRLPAISIFASNAATLLSYGCPAFMSGLDFHDVQIPGADLSGAILSSTDFRGANLAGVYFENACMANVRLQGANLMQTEFSQSPSLSIPKPWSGSIASIHSYYSEREGCGSWILGTDTGYALYYGESVGLNVLVKGRLGMTECHLLLTSSARHLLKVERSVENFAYEMQAWDIQRHKRPVAECTLDDLDNKSNPERIRARVAEHNEYVAILLDGTLRSRILIFYLNITTAGESAEFIRVLHNFPLPVIFNERNVSSFISLNYVPKNGQGFLAVTKGEGLHILKYSRGTDANPQLLHSQEWSNTSFDCAISCALICADDRIVIGFDNIESKPNLMLLHIADVESNEDHMQHCLPGHISTPRNLACTRARDRLASACDNMIIIWNLLLNPPVVERVIQSKAVISYRLSTDYHRHKLVGFSFDSKYLACPDDVDMKVKIWKLGRSERHGQHQDIPTVIKRPLDVDVGGQEQVLNICRTDCSRLAVQFRESGRFRLCILDTMTGEEEQVIDLPPSDRFHALEYWDPHTLLLSSCKDDVPLIHVIRANLDKNMVQNLETPVPIPPEFNQDRDYQNKFTMMLALDSSHTKGKLGVKINFFPLVLIRSFAWSFTSDVPTVQVQGEWTIISLQTAYMDLTMTYNWLVTDYYREPLVVWKLDSSQSEPISQTLRRAESPAFERRLVVQNTAAGEFLYSARVEVAQSRFGKTSKRAIRGWKLGTEPRALDGLMAMPSHSYLVNLIGVIQFMGSDETVKRYVAVLGYRSEGIQLVTTGRSTSSPSVLLRLPLWFRFHHCILVQQPVDIQSAHNGGTPSKPRVVCHLVAADKVFHELVGIQIIYTGEETAHDFGRSSNWSWKAVWSHTRCFRLTTDLADMKRAHMDDALSARLLNEHHALSVGKLSPRSSKYNSYASLFTEIPGAALASASAAGPLTMMSVSGDRVSMDSGTWSVFVVSKKGEGFLVRRLGWTVPHVFLVIEGVLHNRPFLIYADYVKTGVRIFPYCQDTTPEKTWRNFTEHSAAAASGHYVAQHYTLDPEKGIQLIDAIHKDKQKIHKYSTWSGRWTNTLSCTEWVRRKLKLIDVELEKKWYNCFCCLPFQLVRPSEGGLLKDLPALALTGSK